jgi:hypothetical protein
MSSRNNPGLPSLLNLASDTYGTGFQRLNLLGGVNPKPSLLSMGLFGIPAKRKIFVSYHHGNDQEFKDQLVRFLSNSYQVIDRSLPDRIDSENPEYVIRTIRERYINGSSVTLILCGAETWARKYVDWETKATLDAGHGLVGVGLGSAARNSQGHVVVPGRYYDNCLSGYAIWSDWNTFTSSPQEARALIEQSIERSSTLIRNGRPLMQRNSG